jgi:hypothetical protein
MLKHLCLLLYYLVTNKQHTPSGSVYNDTQTTINEYKIVEQRRYLSKNFPWVIKLSFIVFMFWFIFKITVSLGLIEIVKLFID